MKFPTNTFKYKRAGLVLAIIFGSLKIQAQQIANPALDTFTKEPTYYPATAVAYPGLVNLTNTGKFNYIQTITPDVPSSIISTGNLQRVSTDYYDGLGRVLQTVYQKSHADGRDIMEAHVYDSLGREAYQYQPFSPLTGTYNTSNPVGKLKLSANTLMRSFYDYQHPDQQPYRNTVYESSPLGRVIKQMSPGTSWVGSGRGITYDYRTNGYFIYNALNTHALIGAFPHWSIGSASNAIPVCDGNYAQNQLYLTEVTDEDGKSVIIVKDKQDKLIEKMAARTNSTAANPQNPGQLRPADYVYTFYVYDDIGNLRFVIPPMAASDSLIDSWGSLGWSLHSDHVSGYCYANLYDDRNRLIEKKLPGKDVEYFVYDQRDRLVFRQDGNLRPAPGNAWEFTTYDDLDRPTMSGITYFDGPNTRADMQHLVDLGPDTYTPSQIFYYTNNYNLHNTYPSNLNGATILNYNYYDTYGGDNPFPVFDYDYSQFSSFAPVANGSITPPPAQASTMTRGRMTHTRSRIMDPDNPNADNWLKTVFYYDDKGRIIQIQSQNISNFNTGRDISSNIYYFQGQLYKNIKHHENPLAQPIAGTSQGAHTTITISQTINRNFKVSGGNDLVNSITQKIDDGIEYPFENISYDHLGRQVVKQTPAADILKEYNMRGFVNHIDVENFNNLSSIPQMDPNIFDEKLYYDTGYVNKFYNGNIAGIKWRMQGSFADTQSYGYSYDSLNRLSYATYYRKSENDSKWRKDLFDYSVSNLSYDLNGNIMSMNQRGMMPTPGDMDILTYKYLPNSNQLQNVEDYTNPTLTSNLPDFKNNNISPNGTEYGFDHNGNTTSDANKGAVVTYNMFNKPNKITVTGKGTVTYVYDGLGNLLQKRIHSTTGGSDEKWDYLDNFIYKNDTLQFILNEEGRARPVLSATSTGIDQKYVYDYFIKDHWGNVRSTVTATPISPQYLAGYELSQANIEQLVFDNVGTVRGAKPGSTDPNDHFAARLNGDDLATAIGTSIMLKTMPGDKFNISVDALYDGDFKQDQVLTGDDVVRSLLTTLTGGTDYSGIPVSELPDNVKTIQSIFNNPNLAGQLDQLTNANNNIYAPSAHLNYLFFDNNFNLIANSSGSVQVATGISGWNTLTPIYNSTGSSGVIQCNNCSTPGTLLVYIDNQSIGKDVWFDHFMVGHYTSAVIAEDHYYPFGLTTSIDQSASISPNTKKYQGIELEKHFGLESYETYYRSLDPQLGRFNQIDPYSETSYSHSPYAAMGNNPVSMIDPLGNKEFHINNVPNSFDPKEDAVVIDELVVSATKTSKPEYTSYNLLQAAQLDIGRNDANRKIASTVENATVGLLATGILAPLAGYGVAQASPWLLTTYLSAPYVYNGTAITIAMGSAGYAGDLPEFGELPVLENALSEEANKLPALCFLKGTKVKIAHGELNIEDVKIGDSVLSYNEKKFKPELKKVEKIYVTDNVKSLVRLQIGSEQIMCTPDHPFFINGKWVPAKSIKIGSQVKTISGQSEVLSERYQIDTLVKVYNFSVKDNHNYYVSKLGVLVHNSCMQPTTPPVVYTKSSLSLGRQVHAAYRVADHAPALGRFKEFTGIPGIRPDFVNFITKTIYELKPFNPRAIQAGQQQLNKYQSIFQATYGGSWNTILEHY